MKEGLLDKRINKLKDDSEFKAESMILDISEKIAQLMEDRQISKSELAKKIGCSKSYITKLLNGEENLTIKTLSKIALSLGTNLLVGFGQKTIAKKADSPKNLLLDDRDIHITRIPISGKGLGHYEFHPDRRKDLVKDEKLRKKKTGKADLYIDISGNKKKHKKKSQALT